MDELSEGRPSRGCRKSFDGGRSQSALDKAAEQGHTSSVKMLIQNNAKIDIKDNAGDAPLHKVAGAEKACKGK